jgi:hypothetical protein
MPVPPPAISGIDNTVSLMMALADSFDVLPNGKCAGRSNNSGMSDGARVQLRGRHRWRQCVVGCFGAC